METVDLLSAAALPVQWALALWGGTVAARWGYRYAVSRQRVTPPARARDTR